MREIQGRILDFILTADGRQISPHTVLRILTDTAGVEQYKVTQKEDLSIEVRIKADTEEVEAVLQDVQQRCRGLFGEIPLEVVQVDKIDTSQQKYRIVESRATALH